MLLASLDVGTVRGERFGPICIGEKYRRTLDPVLCHSLSPSGLVSCLRLRDRYDAQFGPSGSVTTSQSQSQVPPHPV